MSARPLGPTSKPLSAVPIPKKTHVFISYRVASEAELAEKLCDKLQQHDIASEGNLRVRCFLDKQSLRAGEEWEQGFRLGLQESCLFIPLVSEQALRPLLAANYKGTQDNVLLEYEVSLGV
jgi:TIR domain